MSIVTKKWKKKWLPTATIRIIFVSCCVCLLFGTMHVLIVLHHEPNNSMYTYPSANANADSHQSVKMLLPQQSSLRGGGNTNEKAVMRVGDGGDESQQYKYCNLNENNLTYTSARDAHTMKDTGLQIREHYFGRPNKNDMIDTNDVTVVTQMTWNRFPRLLDLHSQWKGLISVALYLEKPSEATLKNITDMKKLHFGEGDECNVSFHLVINNGSFKDPYYYPINLLRNVATDFATTDYVLMMDVDFVPSSETHNDILLQIQKLDLAHRKRALIVPAFERRIQPGEEEVVNASDLHKTKEALVAELSKVANWKTANMNEAWGAFWNYTEYRYLPFHRLNGFEGHKPTDFKKWFVANKPYKVKYQLNFEPYIVVNRQNKRLPRFWEYFTGYGLNKVSFFEELALANYTFHVLPSSFLVHINHPFTSDRFLRHFVIEEYCRFQQFLRQEYNNTFWTPEELDARTKYRYDELEMMNNSTE